MFDESLLDSSPSRRSVLTGMHWLIGIGVGVAVFLIAYLVPGLLPAEGTALIVQSGILGGLAMLYAVMLCYVWADSRHLEFNSWLWIAMAFLLPLVGFVVYLIYTASKTGDWKRATIPLAYIIECVLVGVAI